jgi:enoyl-CoA hydratase
MTEPTMILLALEGLCATITLNRPEKLNAIHPDMLDQLEEALARIDSDPDCRVVLVKAAGERAFCVGADINVWSALEPLDMWRFWIRRGHAVFDRLAGLRQPTIAVIEGMAFGGGLELAMACDLRLAAEEALFALPEVTIATLPGWGGTGRLPNLIGPARAKQMVFSGERIDAAKAERWGLVNECLPGEGIWQRAHELADTIAANAPVSVQVAKQAMQGGGMGLEALAGALCAGTGDAVEGIAALKGKRSADFKGK